MDARGRACIELELDHLFEIQDRVVSCCKTERVQGLYYMQDLAFIRLLTQCTAINTVTHTNEIADDATVHTANLEQELTFCDDFAHDLESDAFITFTCAVEDTPDP